KADVPALVSTDQVPVEPNLALAKNAVELKREPLALGRGGNLERLAIPTDRRRGEIPADRLVPVTPEVAVFSILKRQLDHPVVRKIQQPPTAVIELRRQRARCSSPPCAPLTPA